MNIFIAKLFKWSTVARHALLICSGDVNTLNIYRVFQ